jgi:hypothetical protein
VTYFSNPHTRHNIDSMDNKPITVSNPRLSFCDFGRYVFKTNVCYPNPDCSPWRGRNQFLWRPTVATAKHHSDRLSVFMGHVREVHKIARQCTDSALQTFPHCTILQRQNRSNINFEAASTNQYQYQH